MSTKPRARKSLRTPGKGQRVLPIPEGVKAWQAGLFMILGLILCGFIIWRAFAAGW